MRRTGGGALPRRYHVLALSTLAGIATLLACAPGPRAAVARRAFAGAGAILGLLVYLLPLAAAMPRPGWGGAADRTPGIVFARYRQAQTDVATDDRPVAAAARAGAPVRVHAGRSGVRSDRLLGCGTRPRRPRVTATPRGRSAESARPLASLRRPAIGRRLESGPSAGEAPAAGSVFAVNQSRSG